MIAQTLALALVRVGAFVRSSRAVPPAALAVAVLVILHSGGGTAKPATAWATSAVVLFPIFAYTTRQVLDSEPDMQRQLAAVAVGGRARSDIAGLIAGWLVSLPLTVLAIAWPWITGALQTTGGASGLATMIPVGVALHLLSAAPAAVLGAATARGLVSDRGWSLLLLLGGCAAAIALGFATPAAAAFAPPLTPSVQWADDGRATLISHLPLIAVHALAWTAVAAAGYVALRARARR